MSIVASPADRTAVRGLGPWLSRTAPGRLRGEVTVAVVTDARIRALNREFRGIDEATDVLSFPAGAAVPSGTRGANANGASGDIAIARGVAARQARAAGHSVATELRVLALHGLLHLAGHDHEGAADHGAMARLEARLRRKGGLPGGLIERAHVSAAPPTRRRPRS